MRTRTGEGYAHKRGVKKEGYIYIKESTFMRTLSDGLSVVTFLLISTVVMIDEGPNGVELRDNSGRHMGRSRTADTLIR